MDVDKIIAEGMEELDKLPAKVQKTTREMRELDIKCTEIIKAVRLKVVAYAKAMKRMTREQKNHYIAEIDAMYIEADELSRAKLALAIQLYDSVDEDISRMDKTAKKLEAGSRKHNDDEAGPSDGARRKKKRNKTDDLDEVGLNVPAVEMPVDPNEPVYCTCHQVSFGEMICCDNTDCKVEWFHFQCVGMTAGPPENVKWYCEACRPSFKQTPNQWNYETNEPPVARKKK